MVAMAREPRVREFPGPWAKRRRGTLTAVNRMLTVEGNGLGRWHPGGLRVTIDVSAQNIVCIT
jgi:hypothetical protein